MVEEQLYMLFEGDIQEFKQLYFEKFNVELSYEEAYEKYTQLLNLTKAIYKKIPKEGYRKLEKRRQELNKKGEKQ